MTVFSISIDFYQRALSYRSRTLQFLLYSLLSLLRRVNDQLRFEKAAMRQIGKNQYRKTVSNILKKN